MKLVIEVYLPNTLKAEKLARKLRIDCGIYSSEELTEAYARELRRDAYAEHTGKRRLNRVFVKPDAEPHRRLICESADQLLAVHSTLARHHVAGSQHEIGKGHGGD